MNNAKWFCFSVYVPGELELQSIGLVNMSSMINGNSPGVVFAQRDLCVLMGYTERSERDILTRPIDCNSNSPGT